MNYPVLNLFAKCSCCGGKACSFCIGLIFIAIAMIFGALLARNPKKAIETQIALYRPFNWKIEPISMEKEIRNTRIMGLALIVLGVLSLASIFLFL